jgi:hypothetical protein
LLPLFILPATYTGSRPGASIISFFYSKEVQVFSIFDLSFRIIVPSCTVECFTFLLFFGVKICASYIQNFRKWIRRCSFLETTSMTCYSSV